MRNIIDHRVQCTQEADQPRTMPITTALPAASCAELRERHAAAWASATQHPFLRNCQAGTIGANHFDACLIQVSSARLPFPNPATRHGTRPRQRWEGSSGRGRQRGGTHQGSHPPANPSLRQPTHPPTTLTPSTHPLIYQDFSFVLAGTRFAGAALAAAPVEQFDLLLGGLSALKDELLWFQASASLFLLNINNGHIIYSTVRPAQSVLCFTMRNGSG